MRWDIFITYKGGGSKSGKDDRVWLCPVGCGGEDEKVKSREMRGGE